MKKIKKQSHFSIDSKVQFWLSESRLSVKGDSFGFQFTMNIKVLLIKIKKVLLYLNQNFSTPIWQQNSGFHFKHILENYTLFCSKIHTSLETIWKLISYELSENIDVMYQVT